MIQAMALVPGKPTPEDEGSPSGPKMDSPLVLLASTGRIPTMLMVGSESRESVSVRIPSSSPLAVVGAETSITGLQI